MQFDPQYANVDWNFLHPREGFITNYAMTAAEEDRAELAAYLLVREKWEKLEPLLADDKRLRKKWLAMVKFFEELGILK